MGMGDCLPAILFSLGIKSLYAGAIHSGLTNSATNSFLPSSLTLLRT